MVKYTLHPVARGLAEVEANLPPVFVLAAEEAGRTMYLYIGEEDIETIHALMARYLASGEHDGEVSHYEVSGRWLTTGEAVAVAAERGEELLARTVRYAAERGHIDGAKRVGRDWLLPQGSFLGWLTDRPKPGPKSQKESEVASQYEIGVVHVLSEGEQIAFVITNAGGFIVSSIPDARYMDVRQAGIIARNINSVDEAEAWYKKNYGQ